MLSRLQAKLEDSLRSCFRRGGFLFGACGAEPDVNPYADRHAFAHAGPATHRERTNSHRAATNRKWTYFAGGFRLGK